MSKEWKPRIVAFFCNWCTYTAITFDEALGKASINEALCKGCGTCVAACPSGSIVQNLFDDEEVFSEIEGVLSYE